MNYKMILYIIGRILKVLAALMLIPMAISIYNNDNAVSGFIITAALLFASGIAISFKKPEKSTIYAREGFVIVALSWIIMSLSGALPFVISGSVPSYIDAVFETVSGFTTTGSSILTDIEALPKSLLFWRSFTNWIGGMGVLLFVLAIIPKSDAQSIHVMRAEVPGLKVGKLVSKTMVTARILYGIYMVMTLAEVILLFAGGMPMFDSIVNSFATAGTGGFSILNSGIAGYGSAYSEIVMLIFMLLFGINFNLFYFMIIKQFKQAFKSEELKYYLGIVAASAIFIAISIMSVYNNFAEALRYSSFEVVSTITTTGFGSADYTKWPVFSQLILLLLMLSGACAGSTGGGLKVSRLIILVKSGFREIGRVINPRTVKAVNMDGKPVDEDIVRGVGTFFTIYMILTAVSCIAISLFDPEYNFLEILSSVITSLSNIGPAMGRFGPFGSFAVYSDVSKIILSFNMLVGRLEIYPILLLFIRSTWKRI